MKIERYSGTDGILVGEELAFQIPVIVDADLPVDSDGNKYLLAGTPLAGPRDAKLTDDVVVMKPTNDPSQAQGILMHDTDLTNGQKPASLVIQGIINRKQIDNTVKSQYYSDDQVNNLKKVLPNIIVIDR